MGPSLKFCCAALSATLMAGCSTLQPPIRQIAVDSNRVFAESADQQTFLNILRAKDKLPTHYSSFAFFRGNLEVRGSAMLGSSLVERGTQVLTNDLTGTIINSGTQTTLSNGVDTFTPSLGISTASNPNFEVRVYDSKEFQSGILTPLKPGLIDFYLGQGWPDEFLSALVISSVNVDVKILKHSVTVKDIVTSFPEKTARYGLLNDPSVGADFNFGKFIEFFQMRHQLTKGKTTPMFDLSNVKDLNLGDIDKLNGTDFTVAIDPKDKAGNLYANCVKGMPCLMKVGKNSRGITFRIRSLSESETIDTWVPFPGDALKGKIKNMYGGAIVDSAPGPGLVIRCAEFSITEDAQTGANILKADQRFRERRERTDAKNGSTGAAKDNSDGKKEKEPETQEQICDVGVASFDTSGQFAQDNVTKIGELNFEVLFRSPESIIYFLGKYLRESDRGADAVYRIGPKECAYRIITAQKAFSEDDLLRVRHRGDNYAMSKPGYRTESGACNKNYHRGPQAMTLAQQLINLHKSSDSLPATSAIQIVP